MIGLTLCLARHRVIHPPIRCPLVVYREGEALNHIAEEQAA